MNENFFTPFPYLHTANFILRPLEMDDAHEIFELRSNDSVNEFLDRPKANTIDDVYRFIQKINEGLDRGQSILWVVSSESNPKLLGTICLWKISWENSEAEIGYEVLPVNQGKGIMQEVIPKIIEYGFDVMKLRSIMAELSPRNVKSVKLLEKNKFEKIAGDEDSVVYALKKNKNHLK
jgi:ribosomal-protein-alanine N-acetyltransferase